jgi:hypothetical protein
MGNTTQIFPRHSVTILREYDTKSTTVSARGINGNDERMSLVESVHLESMEAEEDLYGNGQGLVVPQRARRPFSSYAKMTSGGMRGPDAYEFHIS